MSVGARPAGRRPSAARRTQMGRRMSARSWRRGRALEEFDLALADRAHVLGPLERPVPLHRRVTTGGEIPCRGPVQTCLGPRGIELEVGRLVRMRSGVLVEPKRLAPALLYAMGDPADRLRVLVGRPEVECGRVL